MTILQSIFLGLLQGFTEFLPVSSSGHLLLAQKLFDLKGGLFFDVLLHVGTLLAVIVTMRKSLWQALTHPLQDKRFAFVLVASLPTFAIALAVKLFVPESLLTSLLPIGFALTIVFIVVSHYFSTPQKRLDNAGWFAIVTTGVTQGLAVLPGLSRSGSTISVMKLFGVNASDSAEFSFLLSLPVIVGSAVGEIWEISKSSLQVSWSCIAVGIVASFLSGIVALYMVMRAIKTKSWIAFAVYLVVPLTISLIIL